MLCRFCQSRDVIRHGAHRKGTQRYRCHACRKTFRQERSSASHPEAFRAEVLTAYEERCLMRGVCRVFGVSRWTLAAWLKKSRVAAAPA